MRLWDVASGKTLHHWTQVGGVWWVKFAPQGQQLAAAGERGELQVWETNEGRQVHSSSVQGYMDGLDFSADGRRVVTLSRPGGEVVVWNLADHQRTVLRPPSAPTT